MVPAIPVVDKVRLSREVRPWISWWIVPLILFLDRSNDCLSEVRERNAVGMVPEIALVDKVRLVSEVEPWISGWIVPLILFLDRSNDLSEVREPSPVGMVPENPVVGRLGMVPDKVRLVSEVRCEIKLGIDPLMLPSRAKC